MAAEMLQQFDLSQGAFGQDLLAKHIRDLLDGHPVIGYRVGRRTVPEMLGINQTQKRHHQRTRQCHKRPDPAPLSHYSVDRQ